VIPTLKAALVLCCSVLGGGLITFVWSDFLHSKLRGMRESDGKEFVEERIHWIPVLIGAVERTLFTILVAFSVEASGAFCGGWVTAKAIGGMGPWNNSSPLHRARVGVSLLGSGFSLLVGVSCGLWLRGWLRGGT
jgi:hypothetical protein